VIVDVNVRSDVYPMVPRQGWCGEWAAREGGSGPPGDFTAQALLDERDKFIVGQGLWQEFCDTIPRENPSRVIGGYLGGYEVTLRCIQSRLAAAERVVKAARRAKDDLHECLGLIVQGKAPPPERKAYYRINEALAAYDKEASGE
jgi:hypothetical protein